MKELNFSYRVKKEYAKLKDNRCCYLITDESGFYFSRCKRKVKEIIDGIGLCGIHANCEKKWRK